MGPGRARVRYGMGGVVAGVLAVVALAGCDSQPAPSPVLIPTPTAAPATAPATASTQAPTTSAKALQNLRLTPAVRSALVLAYEDAHHYQRGWITATEPGTVYYAYDPTTATYLAWAGFVPSPQAPITVAVTLQDDGARTAFRRRDGAPWQVYDVCTTPRFLAFVGSRLPAGGTCPTTG